MAFKPKHIIKLFTINFRFPFYISADEKESALKSLTCNLVQSFIDFNCKKFLTHEAAKKGLLACISVYIKLNKVVGDTFFHVAYGIFLFWRNNNSSK